jgi:NADH-quinone oxidoreductase subunit L
MVFVTFFGEEKTHVSHPAGFRMTLPLIVLAVLSTVAGFIELPHTLGHVQMFTDFLKPVLPEVIVQHSLESMEWLVQTGAAVLSLAGVYVAYYFFIRKPEVADYVHNTSTVLHGFWYSGWGFDTLYNTLFVRPFVYLATINKRDVIDKLYQGLVSMANALNGLLSWTQSGILRWYMIGIVIGAIVMVTLGIWVGK